MELLKIIIAVFAGLAAWLVILSLLPQ